MFWKTMARLHPTYRSQTFSSKTVITVVVGVAIVFILSLLGRQMYYKHIVTDMVSSERYSRNPITVVTAYYEIPSKYQHTKYMEWIENFLPNIPCHLFIFTSNLTLRKLAAFRSSFLDRTRFKVKELHELEEFSKMEHWKRIKETDREVYHTPELYAIWNQKWHFVHAAIRENVFLSEYFIWCDIGSFRAPSQIQNLKKFPSPDRKEKFGGQSKLTLLIMNPFDERVDYISESGLPSANLGKGNVDHIGGGLAGGHFRAWRLWYTRYYAMQSLFFFAGLNAGKDQNVMNAVAVQYPSIVQLIKPEPYFNGTGDPWFYLHYYFST